MALLILLSSLGSGTALSWRLMRGHFFKLNNNFIIGIHAFSLAVKLGGVAMYQQQKLRKIAFNDLAKQPEPQDIIKSSKKINVAIVISLLLLIVAAIVWQFAAIH